MYAWEVYLFERCSGKVIATFLGLAMGKKEAKKECVRRAAKAKRITRIEESALIYTIETGFKSLTVDTRKWTFRIEFGKTEEV